MKPNKVEVANRLKAIRSKLNLTISEFGLKIGHVPKGTANSWLRGLALPPKEKLIRIAFLADTTTDWILWGDEKSIPMVQTSVIKCPYCSIEQQSNIYDLTKKSRGMLGNFQHICDHCHKDFTVEFEFYPYIKTVSNV
ncbi:helix-turn-helix domain-containing protein [Bacillus cihuensis]|uniref:helix-turn-helix domain-containing protein n=1 Tax=Bacillus cihuensis TaxID=1208599 RepID=UPI0006872DCB|nr:helix-turn-helix transcriptional regulator [Bacillus cihuensis]